VRQQALFKNGVYESVLQEILKIQSVLPEQILFLQPHGPRPILNLQDSPPSVDDPMRLFLSTTDDFGHVRDTAEIVGWDDKTLLHGERREAIEHVLNALQPSERGLYDASTPPGGKSINLIHIRRLKRLDQPLPVQRLLKVYGGSPLLPRTQAGGWAYVWAEFGPEDSEDNEAGG